MCAKSLDRAPFPSASDAVLRIALVVALSVGGAVAHTTEAAPPEAINLRRTVTVEVVHGALHFVALVLVHVRLADWPTAIEAGVALKASFENEFTLARREEGRWVPIDRSPCFSTIGMDGAGPVMLEVIDALVAQGVEPEQYYAELGHGQQEISTSHAPALRAADEQLLVRETIRGVAAQHGLVASLAPKPWPNAAGNGCHIHFSLWDDDVHARNTLAEPERVGLRPNESARLDDGILTVTLPPVSWTAVALR